MSHDKREKSFSGNEKRAWTEVIKRYGSAGRFMKTECGRSEARDDRNLEANGEIVTLAVERGEVVERPFGRIWQVLQRTMHRKDEYGSMDIFSRASFTQKGRLLITVDKSPSQKAMPQGNVSPLLIARPVLTPGKETRDIEIINSFLVERPDFSDTIYPNSLLTMRKLEIGEMELGEGTARVMPHMLLEGLNHFKRERGIPAKSF